MHWYSGTDAHSAAAGSGTERNTVDTGAVVLGDKGTIMYGSHGAGGVRIIPEAKMKAYKLPAKTIPRGSRPSAGLAGSDPQGHEGRLRFLLRRPAHRDRPAGRHRHQMPGTKLEWDGPNMQFKNLPRPTRC